MHQFASWLSSSSPRAVATRTATRPAARAIPTPTPTRTATRTRDSDTDTDSDYRHRYRYGHHLRLRQVRPKRRRDGRLRLAFRAVVIADATDGLSQPVGAHVRGRRVRRQAVRVRPGRPHRVGRSTRSPERPRSSSRRRTSRRRRRSSPRSSGTRTTSSTATSTCRTRWARATRHVALPTSTPRGSRACSLAAPGPALDEVYAMAFAPAGFARRGALRVRRHGRRAGRLGGLRLERKGHAVLGGRRRRGNDVRSERRLRRADRSRRSPRAAGSAGDGSITPLDFAGNAQKPIAIGPRRRARERHRAARVSSAARWSRRRGRSGEVFRVSPERDRDVDRQRAPAHGVRREHPRRVARRSRPDGCRPTRGSHRVHRGGVGATGAAASRSSRSSTCRAVGPPPRTG